MNAEHELNNKEQNVNEFPMKFQFIVMGSAHIILYTLPCNIFLAKTITVTFSSYTCNCRRHPLNLADLGGKKLDKM